MENCIFCKIAAGEIMANKIYEDDKFFAILDAHPRSLGHSLFISKKHYRWVYDIPEFGEYWEGAKKVALAILRSLKPATVSFMTFGADIPHAHIHIVPRAEISESIDRRKEFTQEVMEKTARTITGAIIK